MLDQSAGIWKLGSTFASLERLANSILVVGLAETFVDCQGFAPPWNHAVVAGAVDGAPLVVGIANIGFDSRTQVQFVPNVVIATLVVFKNKKHDELKGRASERVETKKGKRTSGGKNRRGFLQDLALESA